MVFKIRDKSLFWTRAGWKNNWHPKIFNSPRPSSPEYTQDIRCRYDHHSFLRLTQSYRNYSRILKQYLYGDKRMEELVIMELRTQFKIPFTSECLTDQIKHGGERRMADQLDRDYELLTYNQHPVQLFAYRLHNRFLQRQNEEWERINKGEKTVEQTAMIEIEKLMEAESKKLPAGEKLSLERMTEIIMQVGRQVRAAEGKLPTRNSEGELNDFLEQRRPFTSANTGVPGT